MMAIEKLLGSFLLLLAAVILPSSASPLLGGNGTRVIESFHVTTDIRYRFATTTMVSVVRNTASEAQEVGFDVTLPKEAFIVHFSMEIDGKSYDGEVKEKQAAEQQYQAAVDRGQSAGHVKQAARHANVFEVSVNVASGTAVNFTLTYQELLSRKNGVYEYELHVKPGKPVQDFLVEVFIKEKTPIKYIRTPALRTDALISNEIEEENSLTIVDRPTSETARVIYRPSLQDQGVDGVEGRFVVQYDVEHGPAGDLMVVDGYFVHFFSPNLPPMPKDIIFVLDLSGSMSGTKISQLINAMQVILGDLQEQDRFNIITFSSWVKKWKPTLVSAGNEGIMSEALSFVGSMRADGMTNIDKALTTAVQEFARVEESGRASLVFFLTDGQPTEGVRDSMQIARNVRGANSKDCAILSLAFGSGADFEALKTISAQNSGFARKIYEASDAALQVASLYNEVSAVVMKDLTVTYLNSSVDKFSITEDTFPVVYNGTEIVICGFLHKPEGRFQAEIKGLKKSGEIDLVFETEDVTNFVIEAEEEEGKSVLSGPRDYAGIVERMWAYVTIKQLLKEKEREANNEKKSEELKQKIIDMSLKYKLVTPLTSMVVTKPDSDEKSQASLKDVDAVQEESMSASGAAFMMSGMRRHHMPSSRHRSHKKSKTGFPPQFSMDPVGMNGFYDPVFNTHRPGLPPMRPTAPNWRRPTTTTTTTRRPTTTRRVRPTRPKRQRYSLLSALVVQTPSRSACAVPRKVQAGNYTLLNKSDGTWVTMETACPPTRKCKTPILTSVNVTGPDGKAMVLMNRTGRSDWTYSAASSYDVLASGQGLTVEGSGVKLILKRSITKKSDRYLVTVVLDDAHSYNGMLDALLTVKRRGKKQRTPRLCAKTRSDISRMLKRRTANRYKF